jgi:hypothetical protein
MAIPTHPLPTGCAYVLDDVDPRNAAEQYRVVIPRGTRITELDAGLLADENILILKKNRVTTVKDTRSDVYDIIKRYGEAL